MPARYDDKDVSLLVQRLSKAIRPKLMEAVADAFDHVGTISQARYWVKGPGSQEYATHPRKLTVRTGRLIRSLSAQGGAFRPERSREQIRRIDASSDVVIGQFGSAVPYAGIHETGGTISATQVVTSRQRAFFWAKYFSTNDPRWKASALSKMLHIHSTIPRRPYLAPALRDSLRSIREMVEKKLMEAMA